MGTALIGCWLVESERRRGIGPAAVALLCDWGFDSLGLVEIVALVEPANSRSRAMVSSLGFADAGLQERAHRIDGVLHDMHVYRRRRVDGPVLLAPRCMAVVLAAGRGSRLGGATPKPLRTVGGRMMLDRVLDTAMAATGRPCVVVTSGNGSAVARQARQRGCETAVQDRPAGTAHALLSALEASRIDERADLVLVLNADAPLLQPDSIRRLIGASSAVRGSFGAVLSFSPLSTRGYGRLVKGPDGRMTGLADPEAPFGSAESATGAYCLKSVGLSERLCRIPAIRGEHHIGLLADGPEARLEVVHLDDPHEGLGANTEEELAHLERINDARNPTEPCHPLHRERP